MFGNGLSILSGYPDLSTTCYYPFIQSHFSARNRHRNRLFINIIPLSSSSMLYFLLYVLDWSIGSPQFRMGQVRPLSHPNPPLHDRTLLLSETTPQLFRTYYFNLCLRNGFILNAHLLGAFSLGPFGVELLAFLVRQPSQTFPEPCPASLLLVVRQLPVLGPFRSCHVVRLRWKGFRCRSCRGCCGRRRGS